MESKNPKVKVETHPHVWLLDGGRIVCRHCKLPKGYNTKGPCSANISIQIGPNK